MVLSDLLSCICFPCRGFDVYMYQYNEEIFFCHIKDDDCYYICKAILDNKVLEIDFDNHYVLLSDKQVHN